MRYAYTAAGFALGSSASLLPRQQCCFSLSATGGVTGTVGQLGDGQNRVGGDTGDLPDGQYCIGQNGGLTDGNGRGCILTPPTTQFQCDAGATPQTGFSVGPNGELSYNGDSTFYACPADNGEYNIYTTPVDNQPKCVEIGLTSGGKCSGNGAGNGASSTGAGNGYPTGQPGNSQGGGKPTNSMGGGKPSNSMGNGYPTGQPGNSQGGGKPTKSEGGGYPTGQPGNSMGGGKPTNSMGGGKPSKSEGGGYPTGQPGESQTGGYPGGMPTKSMGGGQPGQPSDCPAGTKVVTVTVTEGEDMPTGTPGQSQGGGYPTGGGNKPQPSKSEGDNYPTGGGNKPQPSQSQGGGYPTGGGNKPQPSKSEGDNYPTGGGNKPQPTQSQGGGYPTGGQQTTPNKPGNTATPTGGQGGGKPSACPTELVGSYETPHLIVPVNSEKPDQAYGTSYNGKVTPSTSSVFNFDIPQSLDGQQCSLIFLFPEQSQLETSSFTFSGSGSIRFDELDSAVSEKTTYNSLPGVAQSYGSIDVRPGNSYVVGTGPCAAGQRESYELSSEGGLDLTFFEDWNPSPIGLFITAC